MFLIYRNVFEKKIYIFFLIYCINVFQTETKIKDLNTPVPISVVTFSRKSLSVVVMDLNICSKFIFQWVQTLCRRILAAFFPMTVHYFCVNMFQLDRERSTSVSGVVSTGSVCFKSHLRCCHNQIFFIFLL
jgi:hypothetical protein